MTRVCFVCLGNICRSPTAEGVLRHLADKRGLSGQLEIDSAGTAAYHAGECPDSRSSQAARRRGIKLEGEARQFVAADFERFDYVLAMDEANRVALQELALPVHQSKLKLFLSFDADSPTNASVPDPYYGGDEGFEQVLDLCERACQGLLDHLTSSGKL